MSKFPNGLEVWPVLDSKTGNTVAWAYDAPKRTAYVEFAHGDTYRYFDVPPELIASVRSSPYVSKAIANQIKVKGRFAYEEIK